jgi:hypothetical protein
MDRYLHRVAGKSRKTRLAGIEEQKLTTHQMPRPRKKCIRLRVWPMDGGRAGSARATKGLEIFKLRSEVYLLAHDAPPKKTNDKDESITRRH